MKIINRYSVSFLLVCSIAAGAWANTVPGKSAPYRVYGGNKVDADTFAGWKLWQLSDCASCHGTDQNGGAAPSLNERLRSLDEAQFKSVVLDGRPARGMPKFGSTRMVEGVDSLYAYLKGRSDNAIPSGPLVKAP